MFHNFSYGYYEAAIKGKFPFQQWSLLHNYIYPVLIPYDVEVTIVSKL